MRQPIKVFVVWLQDSPVLWLEFCLLQLKPVQHIPISRSKFRKHYAQKKKIKKPILLWTKHLTVAHLHDSFRYQVGCLPRSHHYYFRTSYTPGPVLNMSLFWALESCSIFCIMFMRTLLERKVTSFAFLRVSICPILMQILPYVSFLLC